MKDVEALNNKVAEPRMAFKEWVEQQEEMGDNLDRFFALVEKYADIPELTPAIVNEFIKKIIVYAPDKSSGRRTQEIHIIFNFMDEVGLPEVNGSVIVEQIKKCRGRRDHAITPPSAAIVPYHQ